MGIDLGNMHRSNKPGLVGWVCGLGKRGLLVAKVKFPLPESALSGTWREYGEIQEAFFIRPSSKDRTMQS